MEIFHKVNSTKIKQTKIFFVCLLMTSQCIRTYFLVSCGFPSLLIFIFYVFIYSHVFISPHEYNTVVIVKDILFELNFYDDSGNLGHILAFFDFFRESLNFVKSDDLIFTCLTIDFIEFNFNFILLKSVGFIYIFVFNSSNCTKLLLHFR